MKTVSIGFRLTENEKNKVVVEAATRDVPVSQIIREALKLYFQRSEEYEDYKERVQGVSRFIRTNREKV